MKEKFSQRLRRLRTEARLSQEGLAYRLEVSRNSIGNWELGKSRPSALKTKEIANIFNVSVAYLCCQTDVKYQMLPTPFAGIDMSKLNTDGMTKMREYYELLMKDEQYRAGN